MKNEAVLRTLQILAILAGLAYCISSVTTVYAQAEQEEEKQMQAPQGATVIYIFDEQVVKEKTAAEIVIHAPAPKQFESFDIPEKYIKSGGDFPKDLQEYTYLQCEDHDVPYSLVVAMIEVESGYKNDAVSSCGAIGYMQVCEKWHRDRMADYGYENLKDAKANLAVGIDYMAELLGKYDTEQALVVYNVGTPVAKSSSYSKAVMRRMKELEVELD